MIVRIANEGQYELPERDLAALNELDNAAVLACADDDEDRFRAVFGELIALVRSQGTRVGIDALVVSDIILPPSDVTLADAQADFHGEGLIPD